MEENQLEIENVADMLCLCYCFPFTKVFYWSSFYCFKLMKNLNDVKLANVWLIDLQDLLRLYINISYSDQRI